MNEAVKVRTDARGVARITLNRPENHNAFNDTLLHELAGAFRSRDEARDVRIIVLTGTGKSFCSGGDLAWMRAIKDKSRSERIVGSAAVAEVFRVADTVTKPVIVRVNGPAYGGGVGLVSVADSAIAVDSARFALSEVRLGLVPANISPYVVRRIGTANARRYGLSGRTFSAEEARRIGLVHEVVSEDDLDAAVEREIAAFLEAPPEAIKITKALIAYVSAHSNDENIRYTTERLADAWETECGREGIRCFLEKTIPSWRARSEKS